MYSTTLQRHKGNSKANEYRRINAFTVPKSQPKKNKLDEPVKVFGKEELIKLIEDSESTVRDIKKSLKHFRENFGRKHFAPHLKESS